jgi:carboxymethylenebutenolidase
MEHPITAQTMLISSRDGDEIQTYRAMPSTSGSRGGVVVIHHMPGWDRWSKEVARRFAVDGYDVLCPNLYYRQAPGAEPDDAAATARAGGGITDEQVIADVGGAVDYLRSLASSNGKVAVIGHCSGGRQSILVAANVDIDGAVDCYGAFVIGGTPEGYPVTMSSLEDQLAKINCPVLGLFGADDTHPPTADVDELGKQLTALGVEHELHSYDGASHAFFATDRTAYRVEAAVDGYERIDAFFARVLGVDT